MDSEVPEVATIIEDDTVGFADGKPPVGGCLAVGIGIVFILIGIPMSVCPGPGIATMALGLGFLLRGLGVRPTHG